MLKRWMPLFFRRSETDNRMAAIRAATEHFTEGNLVDAATIAENVLLECSDHVPARLLMSKIFCLQDRSQAALEIFQSAPKSCFKTPGFLIAYGQLLQKSGNTDEAELFFRKAVQLGADSSEPGKVLAVFLLNLQRNQDAFDVLEDLLKKEPQGRDLAAWYGQAAFCLNRYAIAADYLARAHRTQPLDTLGVFLLGASLINCGRMIEAESVISDELGVRPETSCLEWLLGLKHLLCGDWEAGFRLYERRYEAAREYPELFGGGVFEVAANANSCIARWRGENLAGKRLLLVLEEGLGDAVMNFRFLRVLLEEYEPAQIALQGDPALEGLLGLCSGIDSQRLVMQGGRKLEPDAHDFRCSAMSLPYLLGIRPDEMRGAAPYFQLSEAQTAQWRQKLRQKPGVKVGLAWAGNPKMPLDALRSLPLLLLSPLFSCSGITFVSLQKDRDAQEELRASGLQAVDWMDECSSLSDTAALIDSLDLIISVDTVVAHLAGALGKPVWLLNRFESEWRWMRGKDESVWYPSMRIYSQIESRNWGEVVSRLKDDLNSWTAAYAQSSQENRSLAL